MYSKISDFNEKKAILDRYIMSANANWNDAVKTEFFNNDINMLTNQYNSMESAMRDAAAAVENIERFINSL